MVVFATIGNKSAVMPHISNASGFMETMNFQLNLFMRAKIDDQENNQTSKSIDQPVLKCVSG